MTHTAMQNRPQYLPGHSLVKNMVEFSKETGADNFLQQGQRNLPLHRASARPVLIVLADDDEDDRDMFAEAVREIDVKVNLEVAHDGNGLLNRLLSTEKSIPDVVFLDLNMPDKNGRECLDIIRKTKRLKDIKVVIYSTSSSQADINDTYDKGANLYISKPPTYNKLMLIMKEVLTMHWAEYMPFGNKRNFVFSIKN